MEWNALSLNSFCTNKTNLLNHLGGFVGLCVSKISQCERELGRDLICAYEHGIHFHRKSTIVIINISHEGKHCVVIV